MKTVVKNGKISNLPRKKSEKKTYYGKKKLILLWSFIVSVTADYENSSKNRKKDQFKEKKF